MYTHIHTNDNRNNTDEHNDNHNNSFNIVDARFATVGFPADAPTIRREV